MIHLTVKDVLPFLADGLSVSIKYLSAKYPLDNVPFNSCIVSVSHVDFKVNVDSIKLPDWVLSSYIKSIDSNYDGELVIFLLDIK